MNKEITNNEASEDYPLGDGSIEPYDIQREQELLDNDGVYDLMKMIKYMNKYTSLKLSKMLNEAGFEKESKYFWVNGKLLRETNELELLNCGEIIENRLHKFDGEIPKIIIPAYDLLWDICIKYAKEIFKGNSKNSETQNIFYRRRHTENIIILLQQNKKEETEDYIIKNSSLFEK